VNWEAISAIGQIVGALAVAISLIYLASEVRSSARATRIASERSFVEMFIRFAQQLAEHLHLGELYYRGIHPHAVEKDREILVLFDVLSLGSRSPLENHSCGSGSAASEMGDDELLINSLKTAFVWERRHSSAGRAADL